MAIAGEIQYKVSVDTTGLKTGLSKAEEMTSKFKGTMSGLLTGSAKLFGKTLVAGIASATTALAGLSVSAVKSYADMEQLEGGVNKIFGEEAAKAVIKNAEEAYRVAGVSANKYMEQATSFSASLISSLSGDTQKAASITDMAIRDMADNMNTFGSSMESIQNAYQGFAKQNYTMLDNLKLGYGGTKQEMERLLADAEKLTGVHYDINNLADVYSAIHAIQEELHIADTTANEAATTIAGSAMQMKAAWENAIAGIADENANFEQLLDNLIESITGFSKQIAPRIVVAVKGAVKLVGELVPELAKMIPSLLKELVPAVVQAAQDLLLAVVNALPDILNVLLDSIPMLVEAIYKILDGVMQALPTILMALVDIVIAIAEALVQPSNLQILLDASIQLLFAIVNAIPDIINALADALPELISSIIAFLTDPNTILKLTEASVVLFLALVGAIPQIMDALFKAFGKLFSDLWDKLTKVFTEFAGNFGQRIAGTFKNAINNVLAYIENFINAPINTLNGFIDTINKVFGSVGVNLGKVGNVRLGRMATGGIVQSARGGQLILAGEGGEDEWVVPESKMASMIEKLTNNGANTLGGGITINVYGTFATSEQEQRNVAEQIYEKLQEINKSRMGAYLQ